jgi:hypothetical protein
MKTFFKTSGAVLVAGLALAACGSAKVTSQTGAKKPSKTVSAKTVSSKPGFHTLPTSGALFLTLPYGGKATPTIMYFAQQNPSFYHEIINPKDWVYSKTFGRHIFVGHYTSRTTYAQVRDAKIGAMNSMELYTLEAKYETKWPTVLNGFNYDAFGQKTISQANLVSFYKSAVAHGHPSMVHAVPSEATIIESPVGKITPTQMPKSSGAPQQATLGICIPRRFEDVSANSGNPIGTSTTLGHSSTDIYFADYGNTNVILSPSKTTGVWSAPTSTCANFH